MTRRTTFAFVAALGVSFPAFAQTRPATVPPKEGLSLTVYSSADPASFDPAEYVRLIQQNPYYRQQMPMPGYGVVREVRSLDLKQGPNDFRFTDVAAGIDPTTVTFLSLTDPKSTGVLEQNFEYDLVSAQKLLQKYVDKQVTVERAIGDKVETITGTLLSAESGLILKTDTGVRIINGYTGVSLADSAQLITRPTLVWNLTAAQAGEQVAQVTYQTSGITWRADYSIVLSADDTRADFSSWVTLLNQSGASYKDASLKLVAGDVQRVSRNGRDTDDFSRARKSMADVNGAVAFAQKAFLEYHLYTLSRPTTLPDNSTKQIELIEPRLDVPAEKVYVYYGSPVPNEWYSRTDPFIDRDLGTPMNKKVDFYLRMINDEQHGMGVPLPAGRVRVYKVDDADGNREFVGEDVIDHTPKGEKLLFKLGSAFDLVGERKQTDFTVNANGHIITESFEIKLRNQKEKDAVTVLVKEDLFRWANWEITASSDKWEKQDARTIHFPVQVKPGEEKVVTYTVKYTW